MNSLATFWSGNVGNAKSDTEVTRPRTPAQFTTLHMVAGDFLGFSFQLISTKATFTPPTRQQVIISWRVWQTL